MCLLRGIGAKRGLASSHAVDVAHLQEGSCLVEFPIGPGVVGNGAALPFTSCEHHVATCKGVLGACHDHHGIGVGDPHIEGKHLALFLLPCVDC